MSALHFLALLTTTLLAATSSFVAAYPTTAASTPYRVNEVYAPPVTSPNSSSIWNAGETQTVTWSTYELDAQGSTTTGYLLLGYYLPGDDSEHLDIKHPLSHGFELGAGSVDIIVPDVVNRDSYIIVLLGDSGDASQPFTINGSNSSATGVPAGTASPASLL